MDIDGLPELDDEASPGLFRSGYLRLACCMGGALKQIPFLARRRDARLTEGA